MTIFNRNAPPGRANVVVAWWMIGLSMLAGMAAGLWSFGGPLSPPPGLEAYDALPRRLLRLAHVAAIALPILNLHYVAWIGRTRWDARTRAAGCRLLLAGTMGLPATLAAAAFWGPAKYALPLPAGATAAAVFLLATGLRGTPPAPRHPEAGAMTDDFAARRRARVALPPAPV